MKRTKLRQYRLDRELTQMELAKLSGVKTATLQKLESGINDVNNATGKSLYLLSKALGVTMEDLLELDRLEDKT